MATTKMKKPINVVEKNIRLTGEIMSYLLNNPAVLDALPDNFELVILPEDDPEIRLYNLELLDLYDREGRPIVFARVESRRSLPVAQRQPNLFIPLPLAA